jgi:hypothetical protein
MGIYDKHADAPERLRNEGQEITVKFARNGDGTGTISWDLPTIAGCSIDNLIYDGIVITVSNRPATHLSTSPVNGEYYEGDPTFDATAHTGDQIGGARVVGAFYHDKSTTSMVVSDVLDKTPYYVSAYAVDQVGNYYREGVHAYSLETGFNESNKRLGETPAYHDVEIDTPDGLPVNARTGLDRSRKYKLKLTVNDQCIQLDDIDGANLQTYKDIATELNRLLALESNPILGPHYPNEGKYFIDVENEQVFLWDGASNVLQADSIFAEDDPAVPVVGIYWYKPSTNELRVRGATSWSLVTATIDFPTDPSNPSDGTLWFDQIFQSDGSLDTSNSNVWAWEDGTWCKRPLLIQTRNPLLPPVLTVKDYWYNTESGVTSKRNPDLRRWEEVDPIVWDTDPNTIANGNYWYSLTAERAFIRVSGEWTEVNNIRYEERNASGDLDNPVALHYWFIPSEQLLFQRNAANTAWTEINVVIAANDPAVRASCDVWWNVTTSVDTLFVWDEVNNEWDQVRSFTESATDPALPPTLESGTIWYNSDTEVMQQITGLNCTDVTFIASSFDPTSLPVGVVWRNTASGGFAIWDGTEFTTITALVSENDPYAVSEGTFWFRTDPERLSQRVAGNWVTREFSTSSLAPAIGTLFFDTIEDKLLEWDGTAWVDGTPIARVDLLFNREVCLDDTPNIDTDLFSPYNDRDRFGRDLFRFSTSRTGCEARIEVDFNQLGNIFVEINRPIVRYTPATGRSIDEAGPTYMEIGVGDDGTPDERRNLQQQIRIALGGSSVTVELTKSDLDECIDNALLLVRRYSSYAYQRVFFFLDVFPNQQRYRLINKCVGFNKIVSVNEIMRMRTGFLGASQGTFGGYDIYGYAALQQLYQLGSFDMLSYHLVASYVEDLQYLFADQLVYTWYEDTRTLSFTQIFYNNERVMLDATVEIPEQKLMVNRQLAYWIKKWAIAEAKMKLSQVRGKFTALPGPNGSTTLNSQELITQAENEKAALMEEIKTDRSYQDENVGVKSQFLIG